MHGGCGGITDMTEMFSLRDILTEDLSSDTYIEPMFLEKVHVRQTFTM